MVPKTAKKYLAAALKEDFLASKELKVLLKDFPVLDVSDYPTARIYYKPGNKLLLEILGGGAGIKAVTPEGQRLKSYESVEDALGAVRSWVSNLTDSTDFSVLFFLTKSSGGTVRNSDLQELVDRVKQNPESNLVFIGNNVILHDGPAELTTMQRKALLAKI